MNSSHLSPLFRRLTRWQLECIQQASKPAHTGKRPGFLQVTRVAQGIRLTEYVLVVHAILGCAANLA